MKETADISITIGLLEAEIDSLKDEYKNCKFSALKREYSTQLVSHKQALKMLKQAAALEPLINQEVEKRIKERMPTEEEDDRLAMEYADSTGRKSSTCHNVIYRAYRRALEDCRSRLTCSEKQNNINK